MKALSRHVRNHEQVDTGLYRRKPRQNKVLTRMQRRLWLPNSLENLAVQPWYKQSPMRCAVRIVINRTRKLVKFGVQIVNHVQNDRFWSHRQSWAAEFITAVVAEDHVLQPPLQQQE